MKNFFRSAFIASLQLLFLCAALSDCTAQDFATQTLRATYKLFSPESTATGFFVRTAPEAETKSVVLVTAAHVLSGVKSDTMTVVLRQAQKGGSYARRDWKLTIRRDELPLWTTHPEHDVAVMRVQLPDDAEVTALPLSVLAIEKDLLELKIHLASALFVLGYPTRLEANAAGFPIARHGSIASFPLTPVAAHPTFIADFATFEGDSGGPVFVPDTRPSANAANQETAAPLVLGLVLSQFRHDETVKTFLGEQTTHYPLQLATILQAQVIRDTIARLP